MASFRWWETRRDGAEYGVLEWLLRSRRSSKRPSLRSSSTSRWIIYLAIHRETSRSSRRGVTGIVTRRWIDESGQIDPKIRGGGLSFRYKPCLAGKRVVKWTPCVDPFLRTVVGNASVCRVMWRSGNGGERVEVVVRRAMNRARVESPGNHLHRHLRRLHRLRSIRCSNPTPVLVPSHPRLLQHSSFHPSYNTCDLSYPIFFFFLITRPFLIGKKNEQRLLPRVV